MEYPKCKTCRSFSDPKGLGSGVCFRINFERTERKAYISGPKPEDWQQSPALEVDEDFGCILHEENLIDIDPCSWKFWKKDNV